MTRLETIRSNVADYLYLHEWKVTACKCGWTATTYDDHVDHVAEVLTDVFDISRKSVI